MPSGHQLLFIFAAVRWFRLSFVPLPLPQGDCSKAKKELGWVPEITFKELVKDMMKSDIANVDAGNDHT